MNKETSLFWPGFRHVMEICARVFILCAFIQVTVSCTRGNVYRADHGVPPCEITAPLDSFFSPLFPAGDPGAIVTLMRGDSIVYNHAFGLARLDSAERVTDSTIFNISSCSKIFTGLAVMKMVEDGLISPDDSLSKFFPTFPAEFFSRITVRHILSHTSGLPDLRPTTAVEWDEYLARHTTVFGYGTDYRRYGREDELINIFQSLDSVPYPPGVHFDGQDISYILIVPLVETVTGRRFESWMDENFFRPAGMTETFYYSPGLRLPRLAHGYRAVSPDGNPDAFRSRDGRWEEYDYGEADYFLTMADRGLCSSARDFMRFKRALVAGNIISSESIRQMLEPVIATDVPWVDYGLGTAVRREPGKPLMSYHVNMNGGFATAECWWPEQEIHFLVFSARNDWPQREVLAVADSILTSKGWL